MDSKTDKLWKKAVRDQQKRLKPGECEKFVRLLLDTSIFSTTYGQDLLTELNESRQNVKYELKQLPIKYCVMWERSMSQLVIDTHQANALSEEWQKEKQIVRILTTDELNDLINNGTVDEYQKELKIIYPDMQHIILYLKGREKPKKRITEALIELQIIYNLKVMEIMGKGLELKNELLRLTKAIAEAPFKQQRSLTTEGFKKFLKNDNKQCVRVEGCSGFGRLWQQHLNRLPMVTLEVAEAVIEKYSCPSKLMQDIKTNKDVIVELAELKIKRSGNQALSTVDRRIGPIMAQKLYMLYSTRDPNALI